MASETSSLTPSSGSNTHDAPKAQVHKPDSPAAEERQPPKLGGCLALTAILLVGSYVGINHLKTTKDGASGPGAAGSSWSQKGGPDAKGRGEGRGGRDNKGGRGESRPVPVQVATAERKTLPVEIRMVGNALPYKTVSVISQVSGPLTHVYFKQGDYVKRGQLLFEVDPRPLQATLDQARAQLEQAHAQVAQAQANVNKDRAILAQTQRTLAKDRALIHQAASNLTKDKAQQTYARKEETRYSDLLKEGYVTAEQAEQQTATARSYDATVEADEANLSSVRASMDADAANIAIQQATLRADEAAVRNAQATVNNLQAALRNAQVQLSYTRILSPLDGRTGALSYYEGNVIRANDTTPLVTISQLTPIYVNFSVPEQYLTELRTLQQKQPLRVSAISQDDDTAPQTKTPGNPISQKSTAAPAPATPDKTKGEGPASPAPSATSNPWSKPVVGVVDFIDNTVDTSTGTVLVRGRFSNQDRLLWPGHFVNVSLLLKHESDKIVVPLQAVQPGQNGDYVFVVKPDQTVEVRSVKVERTAGNDAVLASGLDVGEAIVVDGQLMLTPGKQVKIVTPGEDEAEAISGKGEASHPGSAGEPAKPDHQRRHRQP